MQKTLFPPGKAKSQNPFVQPFLKWAGGKRQLLPAIRPLLPTKIKRYYEPFLGGGAVFFDLQPSKAVVNDLNLELINCYLVIRDQPEELLEDFQSYTEDDNFFYWMRDLEDSTEFDKLSSNPVRRASRILYLNGMALKNALQVDREGNSTVPYEAYHYRGFSDQAIIRGVSKFLNSPQIEISSQDYALSVEGAREGDFVYFDPPHDFVSDSASFTGYNINKFGRDEQRRLKATCDELTERGVKWLLSNSDTVFIRKLYSTVGYVIRQIDANHIEGNVMGLGDVDVLGELVISNYELPAA